MILTHSLGPSINQRRLGRIDSAAQIVDGRRQGVLIISVFTATKPMARHNHATRKQTIIVIAARERLTLAPGKQRPSQRKAIRIQPPVTRSQCMLAKSFISRPTRTQDSKQPAIDQHHTSNVVQRANDHPNNANS